MFPGASIRPWGEKHWGLARGEGSTHCMQACDVYIIDHMRIYEHFTRTPKYVPNTHRIRSLHVFCTYPKVYPYQGRVFPYEGRVFPYRNTCYLRIFACFQGGLFWA